MPWSPQRIIIDKVDSMSEKYGIPQGMAQDILRDFLESLHEVSFKSSPTDALLGVYSSLGPEAAWHFWGLIYRSLEGDKGEVLSDSRGMWYETALRLDSSMKRYARVLGRWTRERNREVKKEQLEIRKRQKDGK